jgi:hypothetical protein
MLHGGDTTTISWQEFMPLQQQVQTAYCVIAAKLPK